MSGHARKAFADGTSVQQMHAPSRNLMMGIPGWFIDSYGVVELADSELQQELLISSTNEGLRVHFKRGYQQLRLQRQIAEDNPSLWNEAKTLLIAFPLSYLEERAFSVVAHLITKKSNRLDIVARGYLRLNLTGFEPDIKDLISKPVAHPSH